MAFLEIKNFNKTFSDGFKVLQNISLNGVMTLANIVAEGIYEVIQSY